MNKTSALINERWKYQLKTGGFWGVFMTVFMALFQMNEKPLQEQVTSWQFYFRFVVFLAVGIFVLGYSSWKTKTKNEKKNGTKAQ